MKREEEEFRKIELIFEQFKESKGRERFYTEAIHPEELDTKVEELKEENESLQMNRKESEAEDLRLMAPMERKESALSDYEICPITELKPLTSRRDRVESEVVESKPLIGMNGRTTELQGIELRNDYF